MRKALLLLPFLAACVETPAPTAPPPVVAQTEPELVIAFARTGQAARDLVHELAARCWLDGITRGSVLFVIPGTGEIRIAGETEVLLIASFLNPRDGQSRLRLTGTAIADPAMADRLVKSVETAVETGETACPIAAS